MQISHGMCKLWATIRGCTVASIVCFVSDSWTS